MKKVILTAVVLAFTSTGFAFDFNSLITENDSAQKTLHNEIKKTVVDSEIAAQKFDKNYIADENEVIHNKTPEDLLTFSKEKTHYRPAQKASDKRLAQEFKDLE